MPLMTEAEYPSLTSGTMTPIVRLCLERSERAKKLGRYLYFLAAARTRSFVSCGIESATGERLMTRETVAGESWRCPASCFRLTGLGPRRTVRLELSAVFLVVTVRSLAQTESGEQAWAWHSSRM